MPLGLDHMHFGMIEKEPSETFTFFYATNTIFSNFFPSTFLVNGRSFNCVEQYFQFSKAVKFNDSETAEKILNAQSPYEQKALGQRVKNFSENEWEVDGIREMKVGVRAKFQQNFNLKIALFKTIGTTLVEASPWDRKWGIGLNAHDWRAKERQEWRGRNLLGEILMEVREELFFEAELEGCLAYNYYADDIQSWSEDTKTSDKQWECILPFSLRESHPGHSWLSDEVCERASKLAKFLHEQEVRIGRSDNRMVFPYVEGTSKDWGWVSTDEPIYDILLYFTQPAEDDKIPPPRLLYFLCKFFLRVKAPRDYFHEDKLPGKLLKNLIDKYFVPENVGERIWFERCINDDLECPSEFAFS